MKTKSKALLLTLCAVLLVAASILGTMAYLTSQDTVTNTFTVGNVEITLDEAKVGPDGQALTEDNAERVKANTYKLMPGHEYDKDPTIHVAANSEDCYLFVEVKNGIADIEDSNPYGTITEQMTGTSGNWVALKGYSGIYFYSLSSETPITKPTVVSASNAEDGVKVFTNFKIKDDVGNATLAGYDKKTIVVTAYAVQADGFKGQTAAAIWKATFGAATSTPVDPAE